MKREYVKLGTTEYPLCYSTYAIQRLCEIFGSLQSMADELKASKDDVNRSVIIMCTQLQVLIDAGVRYTRLIGEEAPDAPTLETLMELCDMIDLLHMQQAISAVMAKDSVTTVDVAPEKNGTAAAAE